MNSVKQAPAWFWLLIVGALALKAATTAVGIGEPAAMSPLDDVRAPSRTTAVGDAPTSRFAAFMACSLTAPFVGLAFCRWRYWARSEANVVRPPARRGRRASRRPPPTLPPGI